MNKESLKKRALDLKGEVGVKTADLESGKITPAEYKSFIDRAVEESGEIETTLKAFDQAGRFMANQDVALEHIQKSAPPDAERKSVDSNEPMPMNRKEYDAAYAQMKAASQKRISGTSHVFEFGLKSQGDAGMMGENAFETTPGAQIADGQYFLPGTAGPDVLPQFIPGILELRWFDNIIASLFPSFPTNSPIVTFVREQSWDNNAAPVSEGETLPYSTNKISRHNAQVGDVGNMIKVSDQMVQDSRYFLALVEKRAAQGVSRQEEVQLLAGGGYPGVEGLLSFSTQFQQPNPQAAISNLVWPTAGTPGLGTNTATISSVTPGRLIGSGNTATGSQIAIGILAMLTDIRVNTFFEPTAVVMNPADWFTLRTWTDANGQFFGGNPWGWDYGRPAAIRNDIQAVMPNEQLWGKRIAVTPAIPEGFILAGDFVNGGQILRLGGLRVEMVQTNVDDFEKRLWSMRAYTRVGLATERPQVFELAVLDNVSPL
ncbi:phage major capsid protein [Mycobacterium intracellulare]|uniref:phage major capsid protein n=1 Tax=Mycobacterium intracellulare TaxID=1767 RepID=UPI00109ED8DB|nr:phage major capsid protein [Mycobacterium intracellulare]